MPTITVVLKTSGTDGKTITKRYQNAQAHVNPTTNLLQVYRCHESSQNAQEMLTEFHAETYLYWESMQWSRQRKAEAHTGWKVEEEGGLPGGGLRGVLHTNLCGSTSGRPDVQQEGEHEGGFTVLFIVLSAAQMETSFIRTEAGDTTTVDGEPL